MKKTDIVISSIILTGSLLIVISIMADIIGIDKNPGSWSRLRYMVLDSGVLLLLLAFIFKASQKQIQSLITKISVTLGKFDISNRVDQNTTQGRVIFFIKNQSVTIVILALVLILYWWLATTGTWTNWNVTTNYYNLQADGFTNGTFAVALEPDPRLVELTDSDNYENWPPSLDIPIDMSYFDGAYYLYWGPIPALLILLIKPIFSGEIGDNHLTFLFVTGIFLCQFGIISIFRKKLHSLTPLWSYHLSILIAGTVYPFTLMLASYRGAQIYEAAITSGQFFLLAGILTLLIAVLIPAKQTSHWYLLTGTFWAFALASRLSLIIVIGTLMVSLLYWFFICQNSLRSMIVMTLPMIIPIILMVGALGWYNWVRFGSVLETGLYYQITPNGFHPRNVPKIFAPVYMPQNLYNFFINPPEVREKFPFIRPAYGNTKPVLSNYPLPDDYTGQWVTGLLWALPITVIAFLPLYFVIRERRRMAYEGQIDVLNWIVISITITFAFSLIVPLNFFWTAARYQSESVSFIVILSAIGLNQGFEIVMQNPKKQKIFIAFSLLLGVLSIINSLWLALGVNEARFLIIKLFHL